MCTAWGLVLGNSKLATYGIMEWIRICYGMEWMRMSFLIQGKIYVWKQRSWIKKKNAGPVLAQLQLAKKIINSMSVVCNGSQRVQTFRFFFENWNFSDYGPSLLLLDPDEYLDSIFNDGIL